MASSASASDLARLAAFVRSSLEGLADIAVFAGRTANAALAGLSRTEHKESAAPTSRVGPINVVLAPTAVFAPTSHARARLLRQLHASGLLTSAELDRAVDAAGAGLFVDGFDGAIARRELPPGT